MVNGVKRIENRVTKSFENGVYRITEEKQRFLLLAFDDVDEARKVGTELAKMLGVPFKDHIYVDPKLEGAFSYRMSASEPNLSNEPKTLLFTRPKRVMGAEKDCIKLLEAGELSDEAIAAIFVEKYMVAGHKINKARQMTAWLFTSVKKKMG